MNKLNVNFPLELHKRFKAICALKGKQMTEILVNLVQSYVEREEKTLTKTRIAKEKAKEFAEDKAKDMAEDLAKDQAEELANEAAEQAKVKAKELAREKRRSKR
jgi:hypothetical protein